MFRLCESWSALGVTGRRGKKPKVLERGQILREHKGCFAFQGEPGLHRLVELYNRGHLSNAVELSLFKLPIADLSFLSNLKKLKNLRINTNSYSAIDVSKLRKLSSLELTGSVIQKIHNLERARYLKTLVLNSPSSSDLAAVGGFAKELYIHGVPEIWPILVETSKVRKIKIYPTRRGPLDLGNMSELGNLRSLDLNSVRKGVISMASLTRLTKLQEFHLWDVDSIDSKSWLFELPKLRMVTIWGRNNFTQAEKDTLAKLGILDTKDPKSLLREIFRRT
jgi:hypothetical protein